MRTSSDCGATWDFDTIEADEINMPGSSNPLDLTGIDRQEMYVDYEQNHVYLTFRMSETPNGFGAQRTVMLRAYADPVGPLVWQSVLAYSDPDGFVSFITGVSADPTDGREEIYLMECVEGEPVLSIVTNPVSVSTNGGANREIVDVDWPAFCGIIPARGGSGSGLTDADFTNASFTPRAVSLGNVGPLPPAPARNLRVVYPSVVNGPDSRLYQVEHIVDVSVDDDFQATVIGQRVLDGSSSGVHVLWADLQAVEVFEPALFPASQHANTLHWTLVAAAGSGGSVAAFEQVDTWRSPIGGWQGVATLSSHTIDGNRIIGGFFGDYKHGAPIGAEGNMPKFASMWTEQNATAQPSEQVHAGITVLGGL